MSTAPAATGSYRRALRGVRLAEKCESYRRALQMIVDECEPPFTDERPPARVVGRVLGVARYELERWARDGR